MHTIGFPISHKENEYRRALIPSDVTKLTNKSYLYFEEGYGNILGYSDEDYTNAGANIVSRKEVLSKDIICDPKVGDAEYLNDLHNQTLFGWIHAVQNKHITDALVNNKLTAYAWEDMFYLGRHCFWRNNEIAGEAAILHAFQCHGMMPYNTKVALVGRGNVASGALRILTLLGADVTVFSRATEKLFRKELHQFDVIVNAVLWDTSRKDHLIYKSDLSRMKKGSMIIDVSCDRCGGIESSIPTTIESPTYFVDGVRHYVVDHTPSLVYKTATIDISAEIIKYIDLLIEDTPSETLINSLSVKQGIIIDKKIIDFQNR